MLKKYYLVVLAIILLPTISYAGDKMGRRQFIAELNKIEQSGEWNFVYKDGWENIIKSSLPFFTNSNTLVEGKRFKKYTPNIRYWEGVNSVIASLNKRKIAICVNHRDYQEKIFSYELYLIDNDANNLRIIPVFDKDGWEPNEILGLSEENKILFLYFKDGSVIRKVYLFDINTREAKFVLETTGLQSVGYKPLSSDGENLVYLDEEHYLSILNIKTGHKKRLILTTGGLSPTWSPDDNFIVFKELDNNFYIINSEGSDKHILFSQKRERGHLVHSIESWSPDGRFILFSLEPGFEQFAGGLFRKKYPKFLVMNFETKENLEITEK